MRQVKIDEGVFEFIKRFMVDMGLEDPTDLEVGKYINACAINRVKHLLLSRHFLEGILDELVIARKPKPEQLPKGAVCPNCKQKIIINGSLKWVCNCKVWNYDS